MALDNEQKHFIENKVKELGSPEAVKAFYNKPCAVSDYAKKYAAKIYGGKKNGHNNS